MFEMFLCSMELTIITSGCICKIQAKLPALELWVLLSPDESLFVDDMLPSGQVLLFPWYLRVSVLYITYVVAKESSITASTARFLRQSLFCSSLQYYYVRHFCITIITIIILHMVGCS